MDKTYAWNFPRNLYCVFTLLCLILFIPSSDLSGEEKDSTISLFITPGVSIPIGTPKDMFNVGGGAGISGAFSLPFAPWLAANGAIDFDISPVQSENDAVNMNLFTFGVGPGVQLDILPWLSLHALILGGYGLASYSGQTGGSGYFSGNAGFLFHLSPSFSLYAGGGYRHYVSQPTPFYQGVRVQTGAVIHLGAEKSRPKLQIRNVELNPLFPVFYKFYDDHEVGSISLKNEERGSIKNLKVNFYVAQYMDGPKQCAHIPELKRDEEISIPLYALFTDKVLAITEGTKINAQIITSYEYSGHELRVESAQTLRMYDRNAMSWDDDRRAAAFVTAKDPDILAFSKQTAGLVREHANRAVNLNFRIAFGLFESLGLSGVRYVVDPKTPFTEYKENASAVDFLQFPAQTLSYKAGDCDDLSILYTAILEAAGIETAFITVPGHIFAAFNTGIPPAEAKKLFQNPGDLIFKNETTWIPVEITLMQEGFLKAWEAGAKEWREHAGKKSAGFFPVHEAWTEYEPVGLTGTGAGPLPSISEVTARYTTAVNRFVEREIADKVTELSAQIAAEPGNPKPRNNIGVLYAQYGVYDKAREHFAAASEYQFTPAMVNLGNILFLEGKYNESLKYFNRANEMRAGNPQTLLGIAKANYELENHGNVKRAYDELQRKDPDLAAQFSYLVAGGGDSGRASDTMRKEIMVWDRGE